LQWIINFFPPFFFFISGEYSTQCHRKVDGRN
jgi:hypothetical protein